MNGKTNGKTNGTTTSPAQIMRELGIQARTGRREDEARMNPHAPRFAHPGVVFSTRTPDWMPNRSLREQIRNPLIGEGMVMVRDELDYKIATAGGEVVSRRMVAFNL